MATFLYEKDSIDSKEVTTTLLSNEMMKKGSIDEVQAKGLVACGQTKGKGFGRS